MFGIVVTMLLNIVNCAFIDVLPIEFFYLDNTASFFGGFAVLYLGTYSLVTNVTTPEERAKRLARLDAFEVFGYVTGTLVSPTVLKSIGANGNYGITAAITTLAIVYLLLFVREPVVKTIENSGSKKNLFLIAMKTPISGMKSLLVKKRSSIVKKMILLQLVCFVIYWLVIETNFIKYLYMLLGPRLQIFFAAKDGTIITVRF